MKTVYLLMAEFNSPNIPLDDISKRYFDYDEYQDFISFRSKLKDPLLNRIAQAKLKVLQRICFASVPPEPKERMRGRSQHPLYATWSGMKRRCNNKNCASYPRYGGRGIKVCDRWLDSFENFLADMGEKPTAEHSLDRINNDKGYSPDNCKWASVSEQNKNRRTSDELHQEIMDQRRELKRLQSLLDKAGVAYE